MGEIITGKIKTVSEKGLVVSITDSITGMVPYLHLADVIIRKPAAKFKEGQKVKCRVLSCDPATRKLKLTNKKSLVRSDLSILTSFDNIEVGSFVHGFISAIKEYGCFVSFYNGVSGLIPRSELTSGDQPINPADLFTVGQVVKCRITSSDPANKKLALSLNATPSSRDLLRTSSPSLLYYFISYNYYCYL